MITTRNFVQVAEMHQYSCPNCKAHHNVWTVNASPWCDACQATLPPVMQMKANVRSRIRYHLGEENKDVMVMPINRKQSAHGGYALQRVIQEFLKGSHLEKSV